MECDVRCRLCFKSESECSQKLFDSNGLYTRVYEIAVKYFNPMLFVLDDNDDCQLHCTFLCKDCWRHISDFYEFQRKVLASEYRLSGGVNLFLEELTEKNPKTTAVVNGAHQLNSIKWKDGDLNIGDKGTSENYDNNYSNKIDVEFMYSELVEEQIVPVPRRQKAGCKKTKTMLVTKRDSSKSEERVCKAAIKIQELDTFIADIKPQLECDLCKQNFPNYDSLRSHFSKKHNTKVFVVCCGRKFFRRYLLVDHLRLHVNPDTFKCDICGTTSTSSRTLMAHKRFMHNTTETWKCENCPRKFKSKSALTRHMATHAIGNKDYKCNQCERSYVLEFQLKTHISKVHNETKICDICGKTMNGVAALKQHLLQHSTTTLPKWPCDQCNAELASNKSLKSHKLSFHNDGMTAFICKECGRVTASENALMRHKRYVHEMERKHRCPYCEKAFKKKTTLKEHIATHTGQHLYQCLHCLQTFNNNANMHKHRKRAHPAEWAELRVNKVDVPKVRTDSIVKEVVL